jgi:hypothetical protein
MVPYLPHYGLSTTSDIAQQYSSASIVSLRFHSRNHKIGARLKMLLYYSGFNVV